MTSQHKPVRIVFAVTWLLLAAAIIFMILGCADQPRPTQAQTKKSTDNIIITVNADEEDHQAVAVRPGDIVIFRLRVKEHLKEKYEWSGDMPDAFVCLETRKPTYEFPKNYLPGDDNWQLLTYRVTRSPSGCSAFRYLPSGNKVSWETLKTIYVHYKERE
jgi:hypothetical protein